MEKVVFIATFPNKANSKDGMIQRIKAVDMEFENQPRLYLSIGRKVNFALKREQINENLTVLNLNLFLHFWLIAFYLCKYRNFYIHSLYNFCLVRNLSSFKGKRVCIDVHGSVPEELDFYGMSSLSGKMDKREKRFFRIAETIIFVSQQMKNYYSEKYPAIKSKRLIVKPIFSTNVLRDVDQAEQDALRLKLGIAPAKTVLLYCGNLQKWQNFELTVQTMATTLRDNYHLIILTGEPEQAAKIVADHKIPESQITINSVLPQDLSAYYSIAHYGFILRDAHILNRVAAPTKLVEYLYFGLIPIVKYTEIGDAALLKYDYIEMGHIDQLPVQKSERNKEIALEILQMSKTNTLTDIFR